MKTELRVIGLLLAATVIAAAEMQTWTFQKTGKTIQGEVVSFAGETVSMKLTDGKVFSVPIAYLTESNRVSLVSERATQWKQVEVLTLLGTMSAGRYRKCTVHGPGVSGEILIQLLPAAVEAILSELGHRAAHIADARSWIDSKERELRHAQAAVHDANMANLNSPTYYYVKEAAWSSLDDAKEDLPKLQAPYADYVRETKTARTLKIKNTGFVYQDLHVWECPDPRKPQP